MPAWPFAALALCWLAGPPEAGRLAPAPGVLPRPGEGILFCFATASGKLASLCVGPDDAYLVYRFGTATTTELQYPAVLDTSSWRKFTYFAYNRGGGVANAGEELRLLSFTNRNVQYQLYDNSFAFLNRKKQEDYRREVGIIVTVKGKVVQVAGSATSATGYLTLSDERLQRVKLEE